MCVSYVKATVVLDVERRSRYMTIRAERFEPGDIGNGTLHFDKTE